MKHTTNRYFGSDGSNMGQVHALSISSFQQFVKEALGHPAMLNVSREQFHAMGKADRNAIKRVPYFVPAAFATSPVQRLTQNATVCNLIALDVDDENPTMASVYVHTPVALGEALKPYSFAAYVTASSLPNKPRLRIVVAADAIPVASYPDAVKSIAKMLGLLAVTAESLVPVQPMYLPTQFAGDELLGDHPLLASDFEGQDFRVADIADPGAVNPTLGKKPKEGDASLEDLDFLSATLPEVTLKDLDGALAALDPDMPYMEWLEVAAALRHQFPHQADEAFDLFDKWSSRGKKYAGEKDTAAKWTSLRNTPRGRKPVTARTLMFRAASAGWEGSTEVAGRFYAAAKAWLEDDARTPGELMAQAIRRIAGAPMLAPLERATLLSTLQKRFRDHGLKISAQDLRKEVSRFARVAFATAEAIKPMPDAQLPPWARGICYVAGNNEFYVRVGERKYDPTALDNMFNVHLMTSGSESGRPPMRAQDYLLNVVRIPRVDHYIYDPTHPEQTFFTEGATRYANTYRPTYPEPMFDGIEEVGEAIKAHLHKLIDEERNEALLLDWMAYLVQFPGAKVRWAPLIQGVQGCGKTLLVKLMEAVLGHGNVKFIDANLLFENFNGWAANSQLVVLEEVRVVGHNRHEVMNKLKPAIGNDDVTIRDMYEKPYPVKNRTNYILLTNHQDALALTDGDRRYFVLHSAFQTMEQVRSLPETYFTKLFTIIKTKAPQLRAWLLSHPISSAFEPDGHAPRTRHLKEMVAASQSPLSAAIKDLLADAPHPLITRDLVSLKVLTDTVLNCGMREVNGQALGCAMRDFGFRAAGRVKLADGRHSVWVRRGSPSDGNPSLAVQDIVDHHPHLINTGTTKLPATFEENN